MTDKITTDDILAVLVKPLVWENDGGDSLYASVELGGEFTKYYSIDDLGEYDLWGAYFGVRCHEFGGVVIWKGTGKAAARAAAEAHHRAQVAAALNLDLIERLVAAAEAAGWNAAREQAARKAEAHDTGDNTREDMEARRIAADIRAMKGEVE